MTPSPNAVDAAVGGADGTATRLVRAAECLDCSMRIEQDFDSGIWLPLRCADCDAEVIEKGKELLRQDCEAQERILRREAGKRIDIREEILDGRLTLDSLPDLYAETRTESGVTPERYREVAAAVKDFISIPPLLRTTLKKSVLVIHGPRGLGKSLILEAAVGYAIRELDQAARFLNPPELFAMFTADGEGAKSAMLVFQEMATLDLLAIDDLRRKKQPTNWELSILLDVIDKRIHLCRPTLFSCGMSVNELAAAWTTDDADRQEIVGEICDRLTSVKTAISIAMSGRSLRREASK